MFQRMVVKNAPKYAEDLIKAGIDFLRVEISLGMTLMDIAANHRQPENQRQAEQRAEKACRSALSYLSRVELTNEERIEITTKLNALKVRLAAAGIAI